MDAAADLGWMARAVGLAERARELAPPNPAVGCVLVRDGHWLADGWTQPAGHPHAEAAALAAVADARGATAYVTLEPCAHRGRTPSCAEALVTAGVHRVVVAVADPHPMAAGGGARLRDAGITVEVGPLAEVVTRQLTAFLTTATVQRPHMTLKIAQTVDGGMDPPAGRWVTTAASRRAVHRLRDRADAVLVGSGTVIADNPRLDVRDAPVRRRQPRPVILDARGRIPVQARVVRPGTVVVTVQGSSRWVGKLHEAGVRVVRVGPGADGGVDLAAAMAWLWAELEVASLLAEPGPRLCAALVAGDHVDRMIRHVACEVHGRARIVPAVAATAGWPVVRFLRRGDDLEIIADRPSSRA